MNCQGTLPTQSSNYYLKILNPDNYEVMERLQNSPIGSNMHIIIFFSEFNKLFNHSYKLLILKKSKRVNSC